MKKILLLLSNLQISYDETELKKVFTHNSFSENNNSRYVFLGQFAFRGKVADWIFEHVAGAGTQLQNYLGNIFRNKFLETFFDKFDFKITRIDASIEIEKQKHIFVYALLGFIYHHASEENLERFIFQYFIEPNNHLLPENYKYKNRWDQLIFLCKQQYDAKPKLVLSETEEKISQIHIFLGKVCIGKHQSVSYKYAKNKALKIALRLIATDCEKRIQADETYLQNQQLAQQNALQEVERKKQEKQQKHLTRITAHQEKVKLRKIFLKEEAQKADQKRREAKQKAKEKSSRKGKNTIYKEYTLEEIQAMSNAKRRNLQDRGIIPKGINF